jgi:NAD(P)-dependent dehydrogenase (short-subunit alcohol dehydrogenase family)
VSESTSRPLFDLSGRVAIVTGTSRGLGQQFALALATAGADLVLTSRNRDSLVAFEKEIKALGRHVLSLELDVRNQESIEKMASAAEAAFGHLDILVNNAGCNVRKPALDVTWDDWNLILDTNLRGSFFVAQAVARRMIPRATVASSTSARSRVSPDTPASRPTERAGEALGSSR